MNSNDAIKDETYIQTKIAIIRSTITGLNQHLNTQDLELLSSIQKRIIKEKEELEQLKKEYPEHFI